MNVIIIKEMRCVLVVIVLCCVLSCRNGSRHNEEDQFQTAELSVKRKPSDSIQGSYLNLDRSRYDFGKIRRKKMPNVSVEFVVENTGKTPLIIIKADVSCGCLSVDYPKMPIPPGEKRMLNVNINTKNQEGVFNKAIFIKSNAENDVELIRIVGEIKK